MKLLTYYHTLKYLKFSQIYYRIIKRFVHPKPNKFSAKVAEQTGDWVKKSLYEQKFFNGNIVRFLNKEGKVDTSNDWNDESQAKLWLYNLHYFDDLNAFDTDKRTYLQVDLIVRWINDNPAPKGNGWEPYPTSLRIVNWIKTFLSHIEPNQEMLDSLAKQADYLSQDLEFHLLGNHLFVNAKALIFAGLYLKGNYSDKWLATGLGIYVKELEEQVLPDGGNFELTPMYHAIMLVDLLDLLNLFKAYPNQIDKTIVEKTSKSAKSMINWLNKMSHNDGEISFFNDACFDIAPKNSIIYEYALKLGLPIDSSGYSIKKNLDFSDLQSSGYVSVKNQEYSLIADLAAIGSDYISGHAHADNLSFELSLGQQRIFVNSGISEYGVNEERLRQRKTNSHNTVSVNGFDSSQVWSGFRVAKRARVKDRFAKKLDNNIISFGASHDGFCAQGINCIHSRVWQVSDSHITIIDKLKGSYESAISYLHLHPDVQIDELSDSDIVLNSSSHKIFLKFNNAKITVENTTWHPQFGISKNNKKLCLNFTNNTMRIDIYWSCK